MRFLAILLSFLSLAVSARGAGERTCRILFLGGGQGDPEILHLHDGTGTREVDLPRMNLSVEYKLPAGALTLRLLPSPPADGEAANPAAPSATVPAGSGDIYLLVMPDPDQAVVPVRMQVLDASPERFKPGQMHWYNLTPNDVGGVVGKQKLVIKARSSELLDPPASGDEDYNVDLSFRIAGRDALYPLCETRWVHRPQARMLVFIITEAGSRTPRVLAFPDHREKVERDP